MGRSDFSPGIDRSSLPSSDLPLGGPGEISWGKDLLNNNFGNLIG